MGEWPGGSETFTLVKGPAKLLDACRKGAEYSAAGGAAAVSSPNSAEAPAQQLIIESHMILKEFDWFSILSKGDDCVACRSRHDRYYSESFR